MNKKRKIKRKPILFLVSFIIVLIIVVFIVKTINYHNTYTYKLQKIGYNEQETKYLIKNLKEKTLDYLLTIKYDENIYKLSKEKYFIENNLKSYLKYYKDNDKELNDVIAIVNVCADKEWYSEYNDTDMNKGNLMLVNKFNKLSKDYNPDDLVDVSNVYSFGSGQKLRKDAFDAFKDMFNDAKKEGLTLIINSSYRTYEEQEETYNYYYERNGKKYADSIAARAGFSEHQTGLSIDIQTYNSSASTFENFDEFKWLQDNSYKYGYILRYPKNKEYLTGYNYESWHYRYVGIEVATYIHENNITFDEYYAYFIK